MHFSRILAILAASAIVSAAPAMKDTSGADSSMNSGMGMAVKDKDVMMGADHMDGAMIENGKDGIIANGILRISRAERGIMGKDGMMSKEGMMGKDEMNTLGITKDSGMTFHEEHATGMGNKMIKSMIKRDSLEHTMDEEAGTGMGMKDHLSNTHAMGHGGVDTSM